MLALQECCLLQCFKSLPPEVAARLLDSIEPEKLAQIFESLSLETKKSLLQKLQAENGKIDNYSSSALGSFVQIKGNSTLDELCKQAADVIARSTVLEKLRKIRGV